MNIAVDIFLYLGLGFRSSYLGLTLNVYILKTTYSIKMQQSASDRAFSLLHDNIEIMFLNALL